MSFVETAVAAAEGVNSRAGDQCFAIGRPWIGVDRKRNLDRLSRILCFEACLDQPSVPDPIACAIRFWFTNRPEA